MFGESERNFEAICRQVKYDATALHSLSHPLSVLAVRTYISPSDLQSCSLYWRNIEEVNDSLPEQHL